MTDEWQTECDRLGKIADAAWKRYGDAIDAGEAYPTSLFEAAKKASDDYDRHGELEPKPLDALITALAAYDFRDPEGHPLTGCQEWRELVELVGAAPGTLEQSTAEAAAILENAEPVRVGGGKPDRPRPEWIRGKCPKCSGDLVSNCYYVGDRGMLIVWECWESLSGKPTCDYRHVL